ncbi:hypothetical protein CHS0354_022470 [Potamilus streckersoni]|uniref:Uncharacterized protein n=1 Tax=Potamilus streckersoni TaxID=2493646 RepID=A0AAE0SXJ3_9BIVA|nr:hypothetical protein CHS0354_022470 [Potamilus streckersoni]
MEIVGGTIIIQKPDPFLRKIKKKRTGELHIVDIPMVIPLEATVEKFPKKFKTKVYNARLNNILGFQIKNGNRILEIEREKLYTIKKVFYLHGFLAKTWHKGCIFHRKCHKCGKVGNTPKRCRVEQEMAQQLQQTRHISKITIFPKQVNEQTVTN